MTPKIRNLTVLSAAVCLALCASLAPVFAPASARQSDPQRPSPGVAAGPGRPARSEGEALGTPERKPSLNLGTGVPLVFVEEKEAPGPQTRLVGTSLGSASLSFGGSSVELALKQNGDDPAAAVSLQFVGAAPGATPAGASPAAGVTNVLSGPDPKSWRTNLRQYAAVRYEGLYRGAGVRFEGNGRILKGTYTFAPRAGEAGVSWRYAGAEQLVLDKRTGNVKIVLQAGDRYRVLTMRRPSARQRRGTVAAQYVVDKDTLTLSLKGYNPASELVVETELMYSRHFDDYDARAGRDGIYVVGSVPSHAGRRGARPGRDAFVARLDGKGAGIVNLNILDGGADDAAIGLALSPRGDVYVGGRTNSSRLPVVRPLQEANRGGYDAFVWRFGDGGRSLLGGTYLGGASDDAIEALALDCNGEVAVTGTAGLDLPVRAEARKRFATLFPANAEGAADCPGRFIGHLSPALDSVKHTEFFSAPALSHPVQMWSAQDCLLLVGVPVVASNCVDEIPYDIGAQYNDPAFTADPYVNCNQPPFYFPPNTGWGYHALRWKALKNPGNAYTPSAAAPFGFGKASVLNGHEAALNNAEAGAGVFAQGDPPGIWQSNYAGSQEALAIGAAYYAFRWGSPVYTNGQYYNYNIPGMTSLALGIERVTFCVYETTQGAYSSTNPAQKLDALCDFNNVSAGSLTVGCRIGGGVIYELKELSARSWGRQLVYYLGLGNYPSIHGQTWQNKWFVPGVYIGDPPEGEAHLAELFGDAGDQLMRAFVRKADLDYRAYDAGRVTRTARLSGRVRVADVERAGR